MTTTANAKLAALGLAVLKAHRCDSGCDIDGGTLQDMAEKAGALERRTVTEPCCEQCACADCGADFPTECFFVPEEIEPLMED